MDKADLRPHKGRGAASNQSGRYERLRESAFDDGWDSLGREEEEGQTRTHVLADTSRKVIARNESPDVPFTHSLNPYRGCEHGCIYCFARPTHAYLGLSPGLDFETRLFAKYDIADCLRRELGRPGYRASTLALGAVTDAYQPIERDLGLTRQVLEVLSDCEHPVCIITKSAGVLRDLDILSKMARKRLVQVCISLTSLDRDLARKMEPRAASPLRRLEAIRSLTREGVPVSVLTAPLIPALNDPELEALLESAAKAGAQTASYVLLRLPLEIADLFQEWLEVHYPDRASKIMKLVKETRGGQVYDSRWGKRMTGEGVYADLIAQRFDKAIKRYGLNKRNWGLESHHFKAPPPDHRQLRLI